MNDENKERIRDLIKRYDEGLYSQNALQSWVLNAILILLQNALDE